MPFEKPDFLDVLSDVNAVTHEGEGNNLRKLRRYGIFYRRLRTRLRFGALFSRMPSFYTLEWWSEALGVAVIIWGAVRYRLFRR